MTQPNVKIVNITAIGTDQKSAAALPSTAGIAIIDGAAGAGVRLPQMTAGGQYTITNNPAGGNTLLVYPPTGGLINSLSASYSLGTTLGVTFASLDGLSWDTVVAGSAGTPPYSARGVDTTVTPTGTDWKGAVQLVDTKGVVDTVISNQLGVKLPTMPVGSLYTVGNPTVGFAAGQYVTLYPDVVTGTIDGLASVQIVWGNVKTYVSLGSSNWITVNGGSPYYAPPTTLIPLALTMDIDQTFMGATIYSDANLGFTAHINLPAIPIPGLWFEFVFLPGGTQTVIGAGSANMVGICTFADTSAVPTFFIDATAITNIIVDNAVTRVRVTGMSGTFVGWYVKIDANNTGCVSSS